MGAPVILTPQAEEDLCEIVAFIARDKEERAQSFGDELLNKAFRLGDQVQMGRTAPKQPDSKIREIVHGAYRIIYEVIDNPPGVFVLRFWHAARGTPQIMEG